MEGERGVEWEIEREGEGEERGRDGKRGCVEGKSGRGEREKVSEGERNAAHIHQNQNFLNEKQEKNPFIRYSMDISVSTRPACRRNKYLHAFGTT